MKKYTIIYTVNSSACSLVCYDKVETDNIEQFLKDARYTDGVWYVFDGWVVESES